MEAFVPMYGMTLGMHRQKASGRMRYGPKTAMDAGINAKATSEKATSRDQKASTVHDRLLRANTKDYGSYGPAPTLGKPPFKLIPN
ncbi:hypothetical protein ACLOJK_001851 [Asimina triloba]